MVFYIFTRNKKTGIKHIIQEVDNIDYARKICFENTTRTLWCEFTEDIEYTKN